MILCGFYTCPKYSGSSTSLRSRVEDPHKSLGLYFYYQFIFKKKFAYRSTETLDAEKSCRSKTMALRQKSYCVIVRVIESLYHYYTNWRRGVISFRHSKFSCNSVQSSLYYVISMTYNSIKEIKYDFIK